jgi:hypothetical protein
MIVSTAAVNSVNGSFASPHCYKTYIPLATNVSPAPTCLVKVRAEVTVEFDAGETPALADTLLATITSSRTWLTIAAIIFLNRKEGGQAVNE